jgi:hypothetical protein
MSCLILGDSIAVGLSSVIHGCTVIAKVGMSSAWILSHAYGGNFDTVYISSGSNDPYNSSLSSNIGATIKRYSGDHIVIIAPVNPHAKSVVHAFAYLPGVKVVDFTPGRDNVHPYSYQALGVKVKK